MSQTAIISCSGNFYGSEQVLYDFLSFTTHGYDVFVPKETLFESILQKIASKHKITSFDSKRLKAFYLSIAFKIFIKKYRVVYINEAGHSKYILVLSKIFRKVSFIIHVRMLEDTNPKRWPIIPPKNLHIISISNFINSNLKLQSRVIYDPYPFSEILIPNIKPKDSKLIVGIIGRITVSKGLRRLLSILEHLKFSNQDEKFEFYLYGEVSSDVEDNILVDNLKKYKNVFLMGFETDKTIIYSFIDCTLHLSKVEGLGRIYFESIDSLKPFVGFKSSGIGEIGQLIAQNQLLVDPENSNWIEEFIFKLELIQKEYSKVVDGIKQSKIVAKKIFNIEQYTSSIDQYLVR